MTFAEAIKKIKERIHNVHLDSEIINEEIVFLHKVKDGSVDQSYGLQVAKLAGIDNRVLKVAGKKLNELKTSNNNDIKERLSSKISELGKDINTLTPIEALNILNELLN